MDTDRLVNLDAIPNAWLKDEGVPRVNWDPVNEWIASHVAEELWNDAYDQAASQWMQAVANHLGGNHDLHTSPNFLIVAEETEENAMQLLRHSEHVLESLLQYLGRIATDEGFGRHCIIVFSDPEKYHAYVSADLPEEGEYMLTGGVCIRNGGYIHIALPHTDMHAIRHTILHEMIHELLSHLWMPLWLEEGIVQTATRSVTHEPNVQLDERDLRGHRRYWNSDTIQPFWQGSSFHQGGEIGKRSYQLAEVLVEIMLADGDDFGGFAENAVAQDGGQAAAIEWLGAGLGHFAAEFLGPGEWDPITQ